MAKASRIVFDDDGSEVPLSGASASTSSNAPSNKWSRIEFDDEKNGTSSDSSNGPSLANFAGNYVRDAASQVGGAAALASTLPGPFGLGKQIMGGSPNNAGDYAAMGRGMLQGVKNLPGQIASEVKDPLGSLYKKPISTALDLGTAVDLGAGAVNALRPAIQKGAEAIVPGVARSLAGIPEEATTNAIRNPDVLRTAPVAEGDLNRVVGQPIIDAFQAAKKRAGEFFGKLYQKHANMEGPMQEIVQTPIAQKLNRVETDVPIAQKITPVDNPMTGTGMTQRTFVPGDVITGKQVSLTPGDLTTVPRAAHSYDDLLVNKNLAEEAFGKGDQDAMKQLYKEYIGGDKPDLDNMKITDKDQLQILTRLKREIQQQAQYNRAPITLAPIDTAKDAAFKQMADRIDTLRDNLDVPGAAELSKADKAWEGINDIYDTVQKDLSDPGKAKDTMMKLLRSDTSWLTSGRMAGKVDAIKAVERLSGRKILQPALDELTRQFFKSWTPQGFVSRFVGSAGLGGMVTEAARGNLPGAAAIGTGLLGTSPRVIGSAIKGASSLGSAAEAASQGLRGFLPAEAISAAGQKSPTAQDIEQKVYQALKTGNSSQLNNLKTLADQNGVDFSQALSNAHKGITAEKNKNGTFSLEDMIPTDVAQRLRSFGKSIRGKR